MLRRFRRCVVRTGSKTFVDCSWKGIVYVRRTLNNLRENVMFEVVRPRKTDDWLENSQTCAFNLEARSVLEFSRCTRSFLYVRRVRVNFPRVCARIFLATRKEIRGAQVLSLFFFFFFFSFALDTVPEVLIDCHTIPLVNWPKVAANSSRGTDQPVCGTHRRADLKPADLRTYVRTSFLPIFSNEKKQNQ